MKELDPETRVWMQVQLLSDRADGPVESAIVESGAVCNLRCPFCPTGNGELRLGKELLGLDEFRTILDAFGPGLRTLLLYSWGEPLLNPRLEEMLAEARARGVFTAISTNLSLAAPHFSRERARRLVESGLGRLEVACDGASPEAYRVYRRGGDFELVMANLRLLVDARRRAAGAGPEIVWVFHVHKRNRADMPQARRRAAALGVPIAFKELYFPAALAADWAATPEPAPRRGARAPSKAEPAAVRPQTRGRQCLQAWRAPIVHTDGSVFACCVAVQPERSLGNVFRESLDAIWNGPLVTAMRRYVRTGVRTEKDLPCYGCPHSLYEAR